MTADKILFGRRISVANTHPATSAEDRITIFNVPLGICTGRRCLVDYICDTAIIRADEDYRIVAILDKKEWERACETLAATSGGSE